MRVPTGWFIDLVYDVLMREVEVENRAGVDEMLEVPLGLHPEQTPEAKRRRAEQMRQMMGG